MCICVYINTCNTLCSCKYLYYKYLYEYLQILCLINNDTVNDARNTSFSVHLHILTMFKSLQQYKDSSKIFKWQNDFCCVTLQKGWILITWEIVNKQYSYYPQNAVNSCPYALRKWEMSDCSYPMCFLGKFFFSSLPLLSLDLSLYNTFKLQVFSFSIKDEMCPHFCLWCMLVTLFFWRRASTLSYCVFVCVCVCVCFSLYPSTLFSFMENKESWYPKISNTT